MNITDATFVADEKGRKYHLQVGPGELANKILLVGDPKRAHVVASFFDTITVTRENRGYVCLSGMYQGEFVSTMAIGIGGPSAEIALMEAFQLVQKPVLLRVGTCGGIQDFIQPGDLIVTTGALRLEDTSGQYVSGMYPALSHHEVVAALIRNLEKSGFAHHIGLTASTSSFYAGQGREIPGFPSRNSTLLNEMEAMHVLNFEMESSLVLTLAALNQSKAGCLCVALNNRKENRFIDTELMYRREKEAVKLGLDTLLEIVP
jgi:uridine phosphorylase